LGTLKGGVLSLSSCRRALIRIALGGVEEFGRSQVF
jgi:hypothetical protein